MMNETDTRIRDAFIVLVIIILLVIYGVLSLLFKY